MPKGKLVKAEKEMVYKANGKEEINVLVGKKETEQYVKAIEYAANGGNKVLHVKARGKATSTAIDASLIYCNRRNPEGSEITSVDIKTEHVNFDKEQGDKMTAISSIDIVISIGS